jgi:hypothetical protein
MASRWRRRRLCELLADGTSQMVALRDISGGGARLDTCQPPALGSQVELRHPHAGSITGRVSAIGEGDIRISFDRQEAAIAFALGAIAADMTRD